mmetsp:Transcript_4441/g.4465  ORF Transcript_4441/g.4465 Transcript_4441/m.4465 type:complete len:104 (+) Transcript_4441:63-374(+)
MVWFVNRGKLITGRKLSEQSELSQISVKLGVIQESSQEQNLGLQGSMDSIQADPSKDLSSLSVNDLQGEGFRVKGAGFKVMGGAGHKYVPKEEKLRKFISLKL